MIFVKINNILYNIFGRRCQCSSKTHRYRQQIGGMLIVKIICKTEAEQDGWDKMDEKNKSMWTKEANRLKSQYPNLIKDSTISFWKVSRLIGGGY